MSTPYSSTFNSELIKNKVNAFPLASQMLAFFIWLSIFIPGQKLNWALEQLLSVAIAFCSILFLCFHKRLPSKFCELPMKYIAGVFLIVWFIVMLGYMLNIFKPGLVTGIRDIAEIPRYFIYFLFLVLIAAGNKIIIPTLEKTIPYVCAFSTLVFVAFYIHLPFLSSFFKFLYSDAKQYYAIILRLAAPFPNPNFLGFFLIMCLSYLLFFSKHRYALIQAFLCVILIFATGSRSAWFSSAIVLFSFLLVSLKDVIVFRKWKSFCKGAFVILIVFITILYAGTIVMNNSRTKLLVSALQNGDVFNDYSAAGRLDMIKKAFDYYSDKPFIGTGSSKYSLMDIVDNQFALWAIRLGTIGILVICYFFIAIFMIQWKLANSFKYKVGLMGFWLSVFLMLQTGAFLENYRLFFLFSVFIASITSNLKLARYKLNAA